MEAPKVRLRRRQPAPVSEGLQGLGERLRRARTEAGLSQAQLGAPHFTRAYISAIELGKARPAMKSLEFLADKLGKPVSFFVVDEAAELRRKERELDVVAASSLLSRNTAGEALDRVSHLLETCSDAREGALLRTMAGTALNFLIRGPEAVRHLTAAERLATQCGEHLLLRTVRHQLALAYRNSGDSQRGRSVLRELADEIDRGNPVDRVLQMKVLKDLGAIDLDLGEPESATAYYNAALTWANEIGDVSGLISIYNGLAYAYRANGDLDAALGYLQKALGASEVSNDLAHITIVCNALAVISAERGHLDAAMRHADRALAVARVAGPLSYVASCLNTKAECGVRLKEWQIAKACAVEALEVATKTANARATAAAHVVLAEVQFAEGNTGLALAQLKEAAAIYRAAGARAELGDVLMRLSKAAGEQGDEHSSRELAAEAFEVARRSSHLPRR